MELWHVHASGPDTGVGCTAVLADSAEDAVDMVARHCKASGLEVVVSSQGPANAEMYVGALTGEQPVLTIEDVEAAEAAASEVMPVVQWPEFVN